MRNPQSLPVKDEPYQPLQIATIQQNTHYTLYAAKIQKVTHDLTKLVKNFIKNTFLINNDGIREGTITITITMT